MCAIEPGKKERASHEPASWQIENHVARSRVNVVPCFQTSHSLSPSLFPPLLVDQATEKSINEPTKTKSDVQQFEHVSALSKPSLALTCWHGTHIRTRSEEKFIQNTYILCTISIVVQYKTGAKRCN